MKKALIGSLLGTAVGDSLGLPYEFLEPSRMKSIFGEKLKQNLIFGRGLVSDDTEHSCFVAMSLIKHSKNSSKFQRFLAWKFRWWLLGIPAGMGFATLRSCLKLWLGFSPKNSGVFSAGNGPAMRSPIIGVALGDNPLLLRQYVKKSTTISHTDPRAYHGAMAVAVAAHMSASNKNVAPLDYMTKLAMSLEEPFDPEFWVLLERSVESAHRKELLCDFVKSEKWKNGVSGFVLHTVAAVIHVWLRHQNDFESAMHEIIYTGGDTDTTAAILGGIIGARVGKEGIPKEWVSKLVEWPRSVRWMEKLAEQLSESLSNDGKAKIPMCFWIFIPIRNLFFIIVILMHGLRRLLPPYKT